MDPFPNLDLPAAASRQPPSATPAPHPGIVSGLGIVVLYFALQFGLSLLIGAAIGFVLAIKAGVVAGLRHTRPNLAAASAALRSNPDLRIVLVIATIVTSAIVMAVVVRRAWPAQWARAELPGIGFAPPTDRRSYPAAVLLGFAMLLLGGWVTHLLAGPHPAQQDVTVMAGEVSFGMKVLLALLVVGVAPLVEELVFRGVLLSGLASRMPVWAAVTVSALVFGAAHLPDFGLAWYPVPTLVLLGLVLGWLRVHSHSLWTSMVMHASNNFFAAMAWFVVAHPH